MGIFKSKRLFDAPISFIEYIKDDIEKTKTLGKRRKPQIFR